MARKIISCSACNARFDVSKYPPGSRVRCGRCSSVLTVPAEEDPPVVQPSAPATSRSATSPPVRPVAATPAPASRTGAEPAASRTSPARAGAVPPAGAAPRDPPTVTAPITAPGVERDPLLGAVLQGQYRILRKLGEGGYGAVYEAKDVHLERRVAIKIMLQSRAQSREYVSKFLREARTAAQLSHPNVVAVHGVGYEREHNVHFLAMEFVEGRTLHDVVQERGPLPFEEAVNYIIQSCRGLQAAHERNIIHRDIKPGNLMITPGGAIKITDFGLAKVYDEGAAQSTVIGTPYFMPPEQFEGKARDGRTDIYALGVSFYYMLTLQRPHQGAGPAQILLSVMTKEPPPLSDHRQDLPDGLWPIVKRMIHKDVDQRYGDCDEIIHDLERLLGGGAEEREQVYCPSCGVPNEVDATKCTGCGESLQETCPVCNAVDAAGTKFCGECGANIPLERAVVALVDEARGLLASGRIVKAKEKVQQAQERSPQNLKVVQLLADIESRREHRDRHRDAIRELLAGGRPKEALARLELARSEFPEAPEIAQIEQDVRSALAARESTQSPAEDALGNARKLMADGRLREALAAWHAVLVLAPQNEEAAAGQSRAAEAVERADALAVEAAELLVSGDPHAARTKIEKAAQQLPKDPVVAGRLRECVRACDELDAEVAAADADVAAGRAPRAAERLRALSQRFPRAERVRAALAAAETAGRAASAGATRDRLARALAAAQEHEKARRLRDAAASWREVLELDHDSAEGAEGLARAQRGIAEYEALLSQSKGLLQSGDPEGAIAVAESALEKLTGDPLGAGQLARARTSLETLQHEAERIRTALRTEPDDDALTWARDLATRFSGSPLAADVLRETEDACRAAVERAAEGKAKSLLARAHKLETDGQFERAAQAYEDAVKTAPSLVEAKRAAATLRKRLADAKSKADEAQARLDEGDPQGARELAEAALALLPDQTRTAGILASARAALSEIERHVENLVTGERLTVEAADAQIERVRRLRTKYPAAAACAELEARAAAEGVAARERAARRRVQDLLDRAAAALTAGRLGDAEAAAREAVAQVPGEPTATGVLRQVDARRAGAAAAFERGRQAAAAGDHTGAVAAFDEALASDASLTDASTAREASRRASEARRESLRKTLAEAQELERTRRMPEALAAWERVRVQDPKHPRAADEIERLRQWLARAEKALDAVREALAAGRPEAALAAAQDARAALGPLPEADELLARAKSENEAVERGLREIGQALTVPDSDLDPVVAAANELLRRHPGSPRAADLATRAAAAAEARRRDAAIHQVRRLVRDHRHREALELVAELRQQGVSGQDLDVAEERARAVIDQVAALRTRVTEALAGGRLDAANELLGQVLALLPGDTETREEQARVEEAAREFSARVDAAESARRRGALTDALECYREALSLNQGAADIVVRMKEAEELRTRRDELRRACERALVAGDADACAGPAKELVTLFPEDDDARDLATTGEAMRGMVASLLSYAKRQRASGDASSARATLETLLRVVPGHKEAAALLRG